MLDRLFRRFEATIPIKRPVVLTYANLLYGDPMKLVGVPYSLRPQMLYLQLRNGKVVGIPRTLVIDIESYQPMVEKRYQTLDPADPKFVMFAGAVEKAMRVRIVYLQELRPDPAITDPVLMEEGLPTTVEGRAADLDATWLTIALGRQEIDPNKQESITNALKQAIPRERIMEITFLGPMAVAGTDLV